MARSILHRLTPLRHMNPFDENMAVDAGFETVATDTGVSLPEHHFATCPTVRGKE